MTLLQSGSRSPLRQDIAEIGESFGEGVTNVVGVSFIHRLAH